MQHIKNWRKELSLIVMMLALNANDSAYASNDGKLCEGSGKLLCIPLVIATSLTSDTTQSQSPAQKIYKTIKNADFSELKDLLEKHPKDVRPYQLLRWALENYESGTQEEKRLEILKYLLQQHTDFANTSQKNTRFTGTEYYQLAQGLIDDFYINSYPKKRKYTLSATSLLINHGFTFHPQTEDVIGEDPRERYSKNIKKLSSSDKESERAFYKLLTKNAPDQTSITSH